ncbi:hydrolase [Spirochaetia bacterium]|nr:hydrolase [Spirochaetia bacterium]
MNQPLACGMIASDLDRTLLRNDKTISAYTVSVLKRCMERGIKVLFATARSEKSSERFTSQIQPDGIISNGGAMARCGEKIVYERYIPCERANELIFRCLKTKGMGYITADTDRGYFANHPVDPNHPAWRDYSHQLYTDFANGVCGKVYKLTIDMPDRQIAGEIGCFFPDLSMIGFSGEGWYRFAHREALKERALAAATNFFNIDPAAIAAFGDDHNDTGMLCFSGRGVAVSNAVPEAKAAAVYLCGSNDEDGPAKWIEGNVLDPAY